MVGRGGHYGVAAYLSARAGDGDDGGDARGGKLKRGTMRSTLEAGSKPLLPGLDRGDALKLLRRRRRWGDPTLPGIVAPETGVT